MKVLLWLRAARLLSWHNWNNSMPQSFSLVLQNTHQVREFDLGQLYEVVSVNRTTGKICMRLSE